MDENEMISSIFLQLLKNLKTWNFLRYFLHWNVAKLFKKSEVPFLFSPRKLALPFFFSLSNLNQGNGSKLHKESLPSSSSKYMPKKSCGCIIIFSKNNN